MEETEEEGGAGPISHFYEDGLKVYYPNISSSAGGKYNEFKAFSVFGDFVDQETLFDNVMPPSLRYFLSGGNAAFISYGSANSGKKFTLFGTDFWDYLETIYVPPGSKNNSKLLSSFKAENEDIDDDIEFSMFNLDTLLENSGMKEKKDTVDRNRVGIIRPDHDHETINQRDHSHVHQTSAMYRHQYSQRIQETNVLFKTPN